MTIVPLLLVVAGLFALTLILHAAYTLPSPRKHAERRLQAIRFRHSESTGDKVEAQLRKAVAARRPALHAVPGSASRSDALALRLHRTGRNWRMKRYLLASLGIGMAVALPIYLWTGRAALALAIGLAMGAGLPHLAVGKLIDRRTRAFSARFPEAIDLLVRGLRSGLPVSETLGLIAAEVAGPIGDEFKLITERIRIGKPMDDALQETADRLALPELSFFCIALAVQRETGGNLAETLTNLAEVLRRRAQVRLKVGAMASESKASAIIVGALPFIVFGLVWWVNPDYLGAFFRDQRLMTAGIGGLTWMAIGAFVMAQMVNFEI
ncbi:MAG: type II secretion system F family protein [Novosphingobium sp.]